MLGNLNEMMFSDLLSKDRHLNRDDLESIQQYQSRSQQFQYDSRQNQDISIQTDEGDLITIQKSSQTSIDYLSFDYTKQLKNQMQSVHKQAAEFYHAGQFEIQVEGDLNDEERAEIESLLSDLDGIMSDMKQGNLQSALDQSLRLLENRESLASIEAVLQFSERMEMREHSRQMVRGELPANGQSGPAEFKPINLVDFIERMTETLREILEEMEQQIGDRNPQLQKNADMNQFITEFFDTFLTAPQSAEKPESK